MTKVLRMPMTKLGIVMDSIEKINVEKDSTFAILLESQLRGYEIYYMEVSDLFLLNDIAWARTRLISVKKENIWFKFTRTDVIPLSNLDVIIMRKDPPVDINYIHATYILEYAELQGVTVINNPRSLRDHNEKLATLLFKNYVPQTIIARDKERIINFWQTHGDIILKPLNMMGGSSVFYIKRRDTNIYVIAETLTCNNTKFCIAQKYIPEIKKGDRRVLIIDGDPIPYCLVRIPQRKGIRSNLSVGGYGKPDVLSKTDKEISKKLSSFLVDRGLLFVGIDIIGNYLTEINITSPTGICEIESKYTISIAGKFMDMVERKLKIKDI